MMDVIIQVFSCVVLESFYIMQNNVTLSVLVMVKLNNYVNNNKPVLCYSMQEIYNINQG